MRPDYATAASAAFKYRDQQAALRVQLFGALSTLEQTDPNHATFAVAAHGVVNAYKAARASGAL